jgi:DNA polymerase delta subunit 2
MLCPDTILEELNPFFQKVVVIGSLFKSQPLKPDILKDLSEEQGMVPQPPSTSYVSEKDEIVLEDHNARIR